MDMNAIVTAMGRKKRILICNSNPDLCIQISPNEVFVKIPIGGGGFCRASWSASPGLLPPSLASLDPEFHCSGEISPNPVLYPKLRTTASPKLRFVGCLGFSGDFTPEPPLRQLD